MNAMKRFEAVRHSTEALARRLTVDDQCAQSMPDASPTKWHLAHTTWFFERMLLAAVVPGFAPDSRNDYLFNSYYEAIGPRQPRPSRALLTRPTLDEVLSYRRAIDARVLELLPTVPDDRRDEALRRLELGLQHEQQHQELILTDVKHLLGGHPDRPTYALDARRPPSSQSAIRWLPVEGGLREIGHEGSAFAFDNESPRHRVWLEPFELASRPVSQGEVLEFIRAGGYSTSSLWLAEGWDFVRANELRAPLYWAEREGAWEVFTLRGVEPLDPDVPACHLSFFEADAIARFYECRIPTEAEWEIAATRRTIEGNFVESGAFHPASADPTTRGPQQLFGDVWEWTSSSYAPYPRYAPAAGALGEYNGKFMMNQMVLRGGSCLSPREHLRATYRNFFSAHARWQMTGVRFARWA